MNRKTTVPPDIWRAVWKDYKRGVSIRKLAQAYHIPFSRVRSWVKDAESRPEPDYDEMADAVPPVLPTTGDAEQVQILEDVPRDTIRAYDVAQELIETMYQSVMDLKPSDRQGIKYMTSALRDLYQIKIFRDAMDRKEQAAKIRLLEMQGRSEESAAGASAITVHTDQEGLDV